MLLRRPETKGVAGAMIEALYQTKKPRMNARV
jgi:hypothetical protein